MVANPKPGFEVESKFKLNNNETDEISIKEFFVRFLLCSHFYGLVKSYFLVTEKSL